MSARFQHDCDKCEFLATVKLDSKDSFRVAAYDLYYCEGFSLIARASSKPDDYHSGNPVAKFETHPNLPHYAQALQLAQSLAEQRGFLIRRTVFDTQLGLARRDDHPDLFERIKSALVKVGQQIEMSPWRMREVSDLLIGELEKTDD